VYAKQSAVTRFSRVWRISCCAPIPSTKPQLSTPLLTPIPYARAQLLQLSDRMMEKINTLRSKLVKLSMSSHKSAGGGGSGGVSDAMLKKRLEEESKKIRQEFGDKTKKMVEQEKQIKKISGDLKKVQEDLAAKHAEHARACQDLRDLEASRDTAISQVHPPPPLACGLLRVCSRSFACARK
jgi:hypothetical protein